ncbi:hypothetical protein [Lacticigenium naphthae]|uniref:hypothetical protein n=1 Tax=Lacticigenium naphthae TaxID=515351 RepID=UPI000405891E|nr:hypothetical protein [Lacticigenium naphthae]
MDHTYETLRTKLERSVKKKRTTEEQFALNEKKYKQAQQAFHKETADVEKLEEESLSSFLRNLVGTYDKKMDKEKQEQLQAKLALDSASALYTQSHEELVGLEERIERTQLELNQVKDKLIESDPDFQTILTQEEQRRLDWEAETHEIEEALEAGEKVLTGIDYALDQLDSASSLATWDMFSDSFLLDMVKYNKIDQAEEQIVHVEKLIERYQKEMKDVALETGLEYEGLSQMHRTFDIFFDNIFSDWNTKETIQRNSASLEAVQDEIIHAQKTLDEHKKSITMQLNDSKIFSDPGVDIIQ